jgi:hypothetical protein
MFHIHTKQEAKLYIFYILITSVLPVKADDSKYFCIEK